LERASHGVIATESTQRMGFVFQEPRLLAWRTVRENILLGAELSGAMVTDAQITATLQLIRLESRILSLYPYQLSGGMKMRVSLARALVMNPQALLMDEPFAALDESTRQILQEEVARIHAVQKPLTILVTHSLSEALFLSDRILILDASGQLQMERLVDLPRPRQGGLRGEMRFLEFLRDLQAQFRTLLAEPDYA
jgi:NitT/TauT family transport system ATP-binding protein